MLLLSDLPLFDDVKKGESYLGRVILREIFCDVVLCVFDICAFWTCSICVFWTCSIYFVLDMYLDIFLHVFSIMLCGRVSLYVSFCMNPCSIFIYDMSICSMI